jgi:hypothetical protein
LKKTTEMIPNLSTNEDKHATKQKSIDRNPL